MHHIVGQPHGLMDVVGHNDDGVLFFEGQEEPLDELGGHGVQGRGRLVAQKACNLRQGYWFYAVYDCATPTPRIVRVQDPFGRLLAKAKGSVLITAKEIFQAEHGGTDE